MQGLGVKKFHSYSFKEGCLENSRGRWGRGVLIMKVVSDRLAQQRSRYEERCCQKQSLMMPNLKSIPISCSCTVLLLADGMRDKVFHSS